MHQSFDLYPGYLRHFDDAFDPAKPYRIEYEIHAQRNYKKWRDENGKQIVEPQVRSEGSLVIERSSAAKTGELVQLTVEHVRAWRTWTDAEPAVKQILRADIDYTADAIGSLNKWNMTYHSIPIPPVKFYKFEELPPFAKTGSVGGNRVTITGAEGTPPAIHELGHAPTSLYTLMDAVQSGRIKTGHVDYLDDLTMFRPGLEICTLPDSENEIEGHQHIMKGHALVGPALLPQYIWQDEQSRIHAVIGRNVAYVLTKAVNL